MLSEVDQKLARLIGLRLRQLRNERGWDQVDLEAHLDGHIKRASISDFETGRRLPSLRTLFRIAGAFEVELAELVLSPGEHQRHRVAIAALKCTKKTLPHVAKLLDVS